jgi:HlyD family secretion protein
MIKDLAHGISFVLLTCLLTLAVAGCGSEAETGDTGPRSPETVKKVTVSTVQAVPVRGKIEYVGVLAAHRKVLISSELSGTIEKLHFEKGDRVRKGQILAEISASTRRLQVQQARAAMEAAESALDKVETGSRPEEIRVAEAALAEAEAARFEAERNFKRVEDLFGRKVASQREYDSAKKAEETARARVDSARQQLSLARQGPRSEDRRAARANLEKAKAALALAEDRLKKSILRSPCDGIVASRPVEEGEVIVVPPVKVITQVVDLSQLKITFSIAEKDLHILRKADRFSFTVDAIPAEAFSCRLVFVSPVADPVTRAFPLEMRVEAPDARMADGMTVRVTLPVTDEEKTIKVPTAWLSEEDGHVGLYVLQGGKALFRKVKLGDYYDQRVEILSGVKGEDRVVTNPHGLKSGDPVDDR